MGGKLRKDFGVDLERAQAYRWSDLSAAFNAPIERRPEPHDVGVLLEDDNPAVGENSTFYWFETPEEMIAWVCRVAAPTLDTGFREFDDEEEDRLEEEYAHLSAAEYLDVVAPYRIGRLSSELSVSGELGALTRRVSDYLCSVTNATWIGRFRDLSDTTRTDELVSHAREVFDGPRWQ